MTLRLMIIHTYYRPYPRSAVGITAHLKYADRSASFYFIFHVLYFNEDDCVLFAHFSSRWHTGESYFYREHNVYLRYIYYRFSGRLATVFTRYQLVLL